MIQEKSAYKRFNRMGPGGKRCSCCYPAPGKARRYEETYRKNDERRWISQLIQEEMNSLV